MVGNSTEIVENTSATNRLIGYDEKEKSDSPNTNMKSVSTKASVRFNDF
jgi:hypothetical protein